MEQLAGSCSLTTPSAVLHQPGTVSVLPYSIAVGWGASRCLHARNHANSCTPYDEQYWCSPQRPNILAHDNVSCRLIRPASSRSTHATLPRTTMAQASNLATMTRRCSARAVAALLHVFLQALDSQTCVLCNAAQTTDSTPAGHSLVAADVALQSDYPRLLMQQEASDQTL